MIGHTYMGEPGIAEAAKNGMGFTEVVYKIKSDIFPICTYTAAHPDVKVVLNHVSWDAEARAAKTLITILGPEERIAELANALSQVYDRIETVHHSKEQLILKGVAKLDLLKKSGNPTAFALDYFGDAAIIEPALVKEGYLHTRLLITGKVDLADLLSAYERGLKDGRWSDFKLVRIDDYDPEAQIHGAFTENLTQKQLEVIKTALALGFYNTPRDITLDGLSNIFGISKAAVHNRLQAAERKVIQKFFG
ncbi:MAG: helix-turn-helix domain-containing protein [Candidatus Thermoplasmatota archaeon]